MPVAPRVLRGHAGGGGRGGPAGFPHAHLRHPARGREDGHPLGVHHAPAPRPSSRPTTRRCCPGRRSWRSCGSSARPFTVSLFGLGRWACPLLVRAVAPPAGRDRPAAHGGQPAVRGPARRLAGAGLVLEGCSPTNNPTGRRRPSSPASRSTTRTAGRTAAGVGAFLDDGPPPIVFTLGSSAVMDAGQFYEHSAAAAKLLGRRAVLLVGKDARNRPASLPDGVVAFDYAPFSELFPRAAAVVHHGGIGTTGRRCGPVAPCWSCPTPTTSRTTPSEWRGSGSPARFLGTATPRPGRGRVAPAARQSDVRGAGIGDRGEASARGRGEGRL